MTLRLWQRNVIGAVVTAAALAVSGVFIVAPAWDRYQQTVRPAHHAAAGESVLVDGQRWSMRNVHRSTVSASGAPLPEGTVVLNVVVERSGPAQDGFGCTGYLVEGNRSWRAGGPPCGAVSSLPWTFTVPAAAEPTAVDVRTLNGAILIRLEL